MAYWIHEAGNRNSSLWRFFMCDHLSDLKNLPTASKDGMPQVNDTVCKNKCCPGSKCFCIEDSSIWFLGKDSDKWQKASTGGGIGNIDSATQPIPEYYIEQLFT